MVLRLLLLVVFVASAEANHEFNARRIAKFCGNVGPKDIVFQPVNNGRYPFVAAKLNEGLVFQIDEEEFLPSEGICMGTPGLVWGDNNEFTACFKRWLFKVVKPPFSNKLGRLLSRDLMVQIQEYESSSDGTPYHFVTPLFRRPSWDESLFFVPRDVQLGFPIGDFTIKSIKKNEGKVIESFVVKHLFLEKVASFTKSPYFKNKGKMYLTSSLIMTAEDFETVYKFLA